MLNKIYHRLDKKAIEVAIFDDETSTTHIYTSRNVTVDQIRKETVMAHLEMLAVHDDLAGRTIDEINSMFESIRTEPIVVHCVA